MFTQLTNRILWFDGSNSIHPSNINNYFDSPNTYVTEMTDDIEKLNALLPKPEQYRIKEAIDDFDVDWNLPSHIQDLNVEEEVMKYLQAKEHLTTVHIDRTIHELREFKHRNLFNMLRVIIFIVNTLTTNKTVWGVGRGSSVSSYVLYLIGIHDIDSVLFDLPFSDFIRD